MPANASARDMLFESPPLHHEVDTSGVGFLSPRIIRRYRDVLVTDRLRSYAGAKSEMESSARHEQCLRKNS